MTPDQSMNKSILALDLGATKLAARLITPDSQREQIFTIPCTGNAKEEMGAMIAFVQTLKADSKLAVCGLASAPTFDVNGNVMRWPNRTHWTGLPLCQTLTKILDCKIVVEDDGNAAAIAEAHAAKLANLVYIGLGTGVGGGVVLNGSEQASAEVGHMLVSRQGPQCNCGRLGCLQSYASATAILDNGFGKTRQAEHTLQLLQKHYLAGIPTAIATLETASRALAQVIVSIAELLPVTTYVMGGSVALYLPELIPLIKSEVNSLLRPGQYTLHIRRAVHGALSSLRGAEILAQRDL